MAFRVGRARGVERVGTVSHVDGAIDRALVRSSRPIRRSLVVGDTLYTVSDRGVKANSLATFAPRGWASFS